MKNTSWLPILLIVFSFVAGCKKGDSDCAKSISAVQPFTNPAGYEVLIKTNGFSSAAKVIFGTVEATSRAGGESDDIIATVPAGLSGNVEISVEEGDCIDRKGGFNVSGALPSGVQPSLPQIIIPTPSSPPSNLGNYYRNAAHNDAGISIPLGTYTGSVFTFEFAAEFSDHPDFNDNPVTGTIDTATNVISLDVNRTAKGGSIEHFDGQFIKKPATISLPANAQNSVIFLISKETGRQLILYYTL